MRYYLVTIQYNFEKDAENREVPKAFNSLEEAIAQFHVQMGKDMNNATLSWAESIVFDNDGNIHRVEKWTRTTVNEPIEE